MAQLSTELANAAQQAAGLSQSLQAASVAAQGPGAVPDWAQQLVDQFKQHRDELVPFLVAAARDHNAGVVGDQDELMGVPVAVQGPLRGRVPPGFPPTRVALQNMSGTELSALLHAYGVVPDSSVAHRKVQLAKHVRVTL
ncbi:hypothetical protein GPECTOR_39g491 [Gonium pectorale]|uniref:Uncharacterized protein n=1 Tax=Gonium pectorale TaxID=33097 RepID=A0A150GAX7_GONPE|nr:hypothetical protein GPECTOR_39g491 [Gonium pectorale]|eukprot:KXZ46997.1 hypothetical protein GPECTOR_39g491 [Gonium pectorale]